jgi:hypothetical protein
MTHSKFAKCSVDPQKLARLKYFCFKDNKMGKSKVGRMEETEINFWRQSTKKKTEKHGYK